MRSDIKLGIACLWVAGGMGEFIVKNLTPQESSLTPSQKKIGVVVCQTFQALSATLSLLIFSKTKKWALPVGSILVLTPMVNALVQRYSKVPSLKQGVFYVHQAFSGASKIASTFGFTKVSYRFFRKMDIHSIETQESDPLLRHYGQISAFITSLVIGTFALLPPGKSNGLNGQFSRDFKRKPLKKGSLNKALK